VRHRAERVAAGGVDQHVHPLPCAHRLLDHVAHGGFASHVADQGQGRAAGALDLLRRVLRALRDEIHHGDARALRGEIERDAPGDAAPGPGDDDDLLHLPLL